MPISATGRKNNSDVLRARVFDVHRRRLSTRAIAPAAGFTLIEILVVLVIVAVMAGLLVFAFHDSPQQRLRREASDLAMLLNAVVDEAVMRGVELGVAIDDSGYRFVVFDPEKKQWQPAVQSGLAEHKFPESYSIDFALDGTAIDKQTLERIKLFAQHSEDAAMRPSILILSSGEITPFKLTLKITHADAADSTALDAISLSSDGVNPVLVDINPAAIGSS